MTDVRKPAEVFPVGQFIEEELQARGWTILELVDRMGGATAEEWNIDRCAVEMLIYAGDYPGLLLGQKMADKLGRAFGTSAEVWMNLDAAWRT